MWLGLRKTSFFYVLTINFSISLLYSSEPVKGTGKQICLFVFFTVCYLLHSSHCCGYSTDIPLPTVRVHHCPRRGRITCIKHANWTTSLVCLSSLLHFYVKLTPITHVNIVTLHFNIAHLFNVKHIFALISFRDLTSCIKI